MNREMNDEIDDERIPEGAHADVLAWQSRALDGELTDREQVLLRDHLDGCPRCATVAAQLRATERALRADVVVRPPVGLTDRILARIERPAEQSGAARRGRVLELVPLLRASAALAAGLLLLVGGIFVANGPTVAVAGTTPTIKSGDPALERVLERWQKGHAAEPSFFELLLAPAAKSATKGHGG